MDQSREAIGTAARPDPLIVAAQGSFAVGGTVVTHPGTFVSQSIDPAGQTLHGDHAHIFYQIPPDARRFPLAFLHGDGQFGTTWQTTCDGREGFDTIFLRRRHAIYLIDQPRRGGAGQATEPVTIPAIPIDQMWYEQFRIGEWPGRFEGAQFSADPVALDQFFRQIVPNTGPFDFEIAAAGVAALFDRIGPAVLVSHSQGGGVGWAAVLKTDNVCGVVSYEPGSRFPFPSGEVPAPMPSSGGTLEALEISEDAFMRFTRMPIAIYYGDFIPTAPNPLRGLDLWRVRVDMARLWVAAINRRGGDATVIDMPALGVTGNTHFPFSDLNNVAVADLMSQFLAEKQLDL